MSPETRAFLDSVRSAEAPSADDERRVLSAVHAALATGAVAGAALGVSKGAKLFGVSVASVKAGGALLGLSVATWLAASALSQDRPAGPPAVTPVASTARAAAVSPATPPAIASDAEPTPVTPPATSSRNGAVARAATLGSSLPRPTSSPPAPSSLREEIALLSQVNGALARGDGAAALQRLDEPLASGRRLPAERMAARIRALCLLGRTQEAEARAHDFVREHPTSVQRTAVERSCAGKAIAAR